MRENPVFETPPDAHSPEMTVARCVVMKLLCFNQQKRCEPSWPQKKISNSRATRLAVASVPLCGGEALGLVDVGAVLVGVIAYGSSAALRFKWAVISNVPGG